MTTIRLDDTMISITVNLSGTPVVRAGFGTPLLVSPAVVPGGAILTLTYTSGSFSTALAADVTAGKITQHIADYITAMFSQSPKPATIKAGKVAYVSLAADLSAIEAQDSAWYGLTVDLNAQTDANKELYITAAAAWVEARTKVAVFDSHDVTMYAAGPGDIASAEQTLAHERTSILWSQLDATLGTQDQAASACALARWLAFDPDVISAPFRAQVIGILPATKTAIPPALPVDLTAAEIAILQGKNCNVLLPYGGAAAFLDKGCSAAGRQFHEILTKDWLTARIREDIAAAAKTLANRGRKWPCSNEGVAICVGVVNNWLGTGVQAGHFESFESATGTFSRTTEKIYIAATAVILGNAREFSFVIDFV
jgi:hypothetical protein